MSGALPASRVRPGDADTWARDELRAVEQALEAWVPQAAPAGLWPLAAPSGR
jgi:hypothetical protein